MTFGTEKAGGDAHQANLASQGNVATQSLSGVAAAGLAAVGSLGGAAAAEQLGLQGVQQSSEQANLGVGGDAGSDNTQANTGILI